MSGAVRVIDYRPGPTACRFHASDAEVRGIMGPIGSGKSSTCIIEIWQRAQRQRAVGGIRRSRWLIVRDTYPNLELTTIPDWKQWVDPIQWPVIMTRPMKCSVNYRMSDGTMVDLEVIFVAIDEINDEDKLKSFNITGAYINEAVGIQHYHLIKMILSRCGRYPHLRDGGPTWAGLIMDSNPPSDRHWWHDRFEKNREPTWELFRQPGAVKWDGEKDKWVLNNEGPEQAENIDNLPQGWHYYAKQITSSDLDHQWIRVYLAGEYGSNISGLAVYRSFKDSEHISSSILTPNRGKIVLFCFDWGLNPALVVEQVSDAGGIVILDELCPSDIDLETFLDEQVIPLRNERYQGCRILGVGDPSGTNRSGNDKRDAFLICLSRGIHCVKPMSADSVILRINTMKSFLVRRNGLLVSKQCTTIIEGFRGSYFWKTGNTADIESQQPTKNHHSHGMNAAEYGGVYVKYHDSNPKSFTPPKKRKPFKYA